MTAPVFDRSLAFMDGPGDVAAAMREHDWSRSAVGTPDTWPSSLRTVLQIMMTSRYEMWMAWGPQRTFFCNDAYLPTLGRKRGWLGAPAAQVWAEIWSEVSPRIDRVMATGDATWDEGLLLILERSGFPEETYHTFSYSPLADDAGDINGMLCVVTEVTARVIGERRLGLLGDLAPRIAQARGGDEVWQSVADVLAGGTRDLPQVAAWMFEGPDRTISPKLSTAADGGAGPVAQGPLEAIRGGATQMLVEAPDGASSGVWDRPSTHALYVPIVAQGQAEPIGVLAASLNPYRPFDADYHAFVDLFVGQIAAGLTAVRNLEAERQRAEALAAIDRAKTAFFSNVSHEFRTPLTLMLGPLEDALGDPAQTTAQRERIELAHRNSQRLLRLVNSLLDFSRIEAGRVEATFRPTDLARITAELASSFQSATDKADLALVVDTPSLRRPVYVDPEMWEKIVLNLLSNAFKFTFEGSIAVGLHDDGAGHALLTVRDTGTGIPANELPRVFERFHRVEGAVGRSFEGSGIGLALVQELVRQHGGTIGVTSSVGPAANHGTTFTVTIPFGPDHLPAERIATAADDRPAGRGQAFAAEAMSWLPTADLPVRGLGETLPPVVASGGAPRIVLADDNADLRDYIARLLGERGYDVEAVQDGAVALERIRERRPDLLVTDVMMPRLDGFGLVAALREDAALRDLPIIMLSARAGEEAQIEGLASGADDYLVKPFSARELLARVSATLRMARVRDDAAEAIRLTEARSAAVLEGMTEGYVLVDADFRVVQVNAEALRDGGHDAGDAIGQSLWPLWPRFAEAASAERLTLAMRERTAVTLDDIQLRPGDDDTWIELRAYPAGDGLALFQRDISERKRSERELQAFNETLEAQVAERTRERDRTWNNAQDLLLVIDGDGILRAVNPAWTTILGYPPSRLVGRHALEFIHPDDHEATLGALAAVRVGDMPPVENRYRHVDGSWRWIAWVASREGDRIYASGRNVTDERAAAAELQTAQDQLRQSQKMEAVGQLTGGLAHDFNNLLTGITGSLELLQIRVQKGQTADLDRYINAAQGAARRAAALTHRLLAFSRRQTLDPKPTDVNRLIADLEDLIRRTVGLSIEIDVVGAAGLWPALVDQNQLESALLNLCINGRDAMPDGGRLTIETANRWLDARAAKDRDLPPGQYLSICVTDNGTGMTPDVKERAFDPFFTTKPLGAGTGLGLSMVYGFARQSGGQVRIYSEVGRGTTICIYLPRHAASATDEVAGTDDATATPSAISGRTVLVVDDEPTVRMLIVEVLESMGCTALEAQDGGSALRSLQSPVRLDLLVTDVGLPGGINGRQVADAARKARPGLKTLFITGYAENAVIGNGYLDSGMQVLTKPFTIEALSRRIDELLAED